MKQRIHEQRIQCNLAIFITVTIYGQHCWVSTTEFSSKNAYVDECSECVFSDALFQHCLLNRVPVTYSTQLLRGCRPRQVVYHLGFACSLGPNKTGAKFFFHMPHRQNRRSDSSSDAPLKAGSRTKKNAHFLPIERNRKVTSFLPTVTNQLLKLCRGTRCRLLPEELPLVIAQTEAGGPAATKLCAYS